ncbi:hypothetical protein [Streptomyces xinghaiensis]|uniref:hypothetical protein n=1 Tax=Streptomyces xinghaiensis TaxID=1038928 RepID=UPI00307B83E3
MAGGAVAGAVAGLAAVTDSVPHGGPIVAVLGAVGGVGMFFLAILLGTVVTAAVTIGLMSVGGRGGAAPGRGPRGGRCGRCCQCRRDDRGGECRSPVPS